MEPPQGNGHRGYQSIIKIVMRSDKPPCYHGDNSKGVLKGARVIREKWKTRFVIFKIRKIYFF